jgi:hypothetical protein
MTSCFAILLCEAILPLQPNQVTRFLLECGVYGNFKPAGSRARIFVGDRDSIRDYYKLSQQRPSPLHDNRRLCHDAGRK